MFLANDVFTSAMKKIHQYVIMSAPTAAQYGALEGLRHCQDEVEKMRDSYKVRRNFLVKALNDMGLETFKPQGAFYVFPCIKSTGLSSEEFCEQLLANEKSCVCSWKCFWNSQWEGFVRVFYAYSIEELKVAIERIKIFVDKVRK